MVFRAKGTKTYKLRVDHPDGRHATLSTGCTDASDAKDIEAMVDRWRGRKGKRYMRLDVLDGLIAKRFTLAVVCERELDGTLEEFLVDHPASGVDLTPHIAEWVADKRKAKRGAGQADTYRKQLLVLFPEPTLPLTRFTKRELWSRLDALDVEAPTRNRYRAAASSFAKFLAKREIIERNFVRDIDGFGENDPRLVYYEIDDAKRLVKGLEQPYAAISAAALGFCMEWTALDRALVSDFALKADPVLTHVRGTKRSWRDRYVPLVKEFAWVLDYIRPALAGKLPTALAFDGVPEWRALDAQRAVADALKITAVGEDVYGQHSIHDWRQTHTVALLRWGYAEQIAADHLGHKNTGLVRDNYGRFKPTKHDYAKTSISTNSTTTPKRREGNG